MILLIKEHTLIHSWADLLHFFVLFGRLSCVSTSIVCVFDGVASFVWQGLFCLTWLDFEYFNSYLRLIYCQLLKAYKIYNNNTEQKMGVVKFFQTFIFLCVKRVAVWLPLENSTKCLHIWLKLLVIMICSSSSHVCE